MFLLDMASAGVKEIPTNTELTNATTDGAVDFEVTPTTRPLLASTSTTTTIPIPERTTTTDGVEEIELAPTTIYVIKINTDHNQHYYW